MATFQPVNASDAEMEPKRVAEVGEASGGRIFTAARRNAASAIPAARTLRGVAAAALLAAGIASAVVLLSSKAPGSFLPYKVQIRKQDKAKEVRAISMKTDAAGSGTCFCFAVSASSGKEYKLMKTHWAEKRHIFACDGYTLFSDRVYLDGMPVENIGATNVTKGDWGSWANANVFVKAWEIVSAQGFYDHFHWTLKVDPDTCFFPTRLASHTEGLNFEEPVYLKPPGMLVGALEVFSLGAVRLLVSKRDEVCIDNADGTAEDGFIETCLQRLQVPGHTSAHLLKNSFNPEDCKGTDFLAYHPMKDIDRFAACVDNAQPKA